MDFAKIHVFAVYFRKKLVCVTKTLPSEAVENHGFWEGGAGPIM